MYALRERRQHVTQEDFEFAIAKVRSFSDKTHSEGGQWTDGLAFQVLKRNQDANTSVNKLFS
jgi:26S proteasome regulatory subunit T6